MRGVVWGTIWALAFWLGVAAMVRAEPLTKITLDIVRIPSPHLSLTEARGVVRAAAAKYREVGVDLRVRKWRTESFVPTAFMNLKDAQKAFWEFWREATQKGWRTRRHRLLVIAPPIEDGNGNRYIWGFGFTKCARDGFAVAGVQSANNLGDPRMLQSVAAVLHETSHMLGLPTRFKGAPSLSHFLVLHQLPESFRWLGWDRHRINHCVVRNKGSQYGD